MNRNGSWTARVLRMALMAALVTGMLLGAHPVLAQSPPTLAKGFGAASILIGQTTSLTFTVHNPNAGTTLTSLNFADGLPNGLIVATPNGHANTCVGSFSDPPGSTIVSMGNVTLAPGASCTWKVDVVATSAGTKNNTTNQITSTESLPGSPASASIDVPSPSPPALSKAFGAASISVGQTTSLTFTITNPNPTFTTLTSLNFADSLPNGLIVATPNGHTSTCVGSFSDPPGSTLVSMGTVTLAPGASCTWKVDVVATSAGTKNNTTNQITSTESLPGSPASASLDVVGSPVLMNAASRKTHGAAGTFDLALSLVAPPTINPNPTTEPRLGPAQTIVMTFDKPIASADNPTLTEGAAAFSGMSISGNAVILNFTGVTDMQYVTFSLANVASTDGGAGGTGSVRVGFLLGDVNGSRVVTLTDIGLVNAQLAQQVTATNYLKDVNASGTLTLTDKGLTNTNLTRSLPPP